MSQSLNDFREVPQYRFESYPDYKIKNMKQLFLSILLLISLHSYCQSKDTVKISNDSLEYEIIIIELGFDNWLLTNAKPRGFYSLSYLESQNRFYVLEWNRRYFDFYIPYDTNIKYGYEVNYLLFNYFEYYKFKTGTRLGIRKR